MAKLFTWQDVEDEAKRRGVDLSARSLADRRLLQSDPDKAMRAVGIWADWDDSGMEQQALDHQWMEDWRSSAGYSGGAEGMEYQPLREENYDGTKPAYDGGAERNAAWLLDRLGDYGSFSYDPAADPVYSQYQKAYTREGQRAAEDTLARAAALTGGVPASYALGAAQQAENYYASKLADKLPELEQRAYERYGDGWKRLLQRYNASLEAAEQERKRYGEALDRYEAERTRERSDALAAAKLLAAMGDWSGYADIYGRDWADRMTALGSEYAYAGDGSAYQIGSATGKRWLEDLRYGDADRVGGDGSVWHANPDGTVSITAPDGKRYTYGHARAVYGGRKPKKEENTDETGVEEDGVKEPLPGSFSDFKRTINGLLQTGQDETAKAYADRYELTEEQQKELLTVFHNHGYGAKR